jgi:hypothetical protein
MNTSRSRRASDREVTWMVSALINARYRAAGFQHLVGLIEEWPDARILDLADRIVPSPGVNRDREEALTAIAAYGRVERNVQAAIERTAAAVASELTRKQRQRQ